MDKKRPSPIYSPDFRARAVRLVREHRAGYRSDTAAFTEIAKPLGCAADSLRVWYRQTQCDAGERTGLTSQERERLRALERENRQ